MKKKLPNPGSDAAIKMGCTCPFLDKCHGKGGDPFGNFWIDLNCPIHGDKERQVRPGSKE